MPEKILDEYTIKAEYLNIKIKIVGGLETLPEYRLLIPKLSEATNALLQDTKHEMTTDVALSAAEIFDPKIAAKLKERFRIKANELLLKKLPHIEKHTKEFMIGLLINEMVGLGKIEFLLHDDDIEEIVINTTVEPIRIFHKKHGWIITNIYMESEAQTQNYANVIARRVGRQITTLNPLLDAHLSTGDRVNALFYPIANKGNTITIRKFARDPWTMIDFITNNTTSIEIFSLLWMAIQYEMNILISGGTGSGKTSFLNVLTPFIPPYHRIVSIEDTRELQLPKYLFWAPLTTRQKNPEGKGEITMLDLLINSLRMRPDRIILGEMRKSEHAEVLFEAMHTGHSVYATVHADSMHETIQRLINPPISTPANLLSAVNLNVVMFRDRRLNIRRTYQVGEFLASQEGEKVVVKPNILYRWKAVGDKMIPHATSKRLFEDLSRLTSMTLSEINKDLKIKQDILGWMVKNKIRDVHSVGKIMNEYYVNRDEVVKAATSNQKPESILK